MSSDDRKILMAQALRALGYGFSSLLLAASLEAQGWSSARVGALLTAIVAGTALLSLLVGTFAERIGRRRFYAALFAALALSGIAFALTDHFFLLLVVALSGAMSTEVVESGPFTSLELAMLSGARGSQARTHVFGVYNAVATVAGSVGALAAGGPALLRHLWSDLPTDQRFFLILVPIGLAGMLAATRLSARVELPDTSARPHVPLRRSRPMVARLAGLFAVDAFAGGFVVQSFLAYWFLVRFHVSLETLSLVFFAVGLLQAASFLVATRLANRFGLLKIMVFAHLPSNLLLAVIPLAPTLPAAIALLLCRYALSQMDVPTRQAYVMAVVDPEERVAATAYTNSARYAARPLGPVLAGAAQQLALGLPFFLGGGIKTAYDLTLWLWFRRVPLEGERPGSAESQATPRPPPEPVPTLKEGHA